MQNVFGKKAAALLYLTMLNILSLTTAGQSPQSEPSKEGKNKFLDSYFGNLSVGAGYGLIPYSYQEQTQFYIFNTGQVGVSIGSIPFQFAYKYSSLQNSTANGNYFKISFDINEFRQRQIAKFNSIKDSLENEYRNLQQRKDNCLKQKLTITYQLNPPPSYYLPSKNKESAEVGQMKGLVGDSINHVTNSSVEIDTSAIKESVSTDSCAIDTSDEARHDEIQKQRKNYQEAQKLRSIVRSVNRDSLRIVKKSLNDSIAEINQKLKKIERMRRYYDEAGKSANFILKPGLAFSLPELMHGIKALEIGRCSPNYSEYLIRSVNFDGIYSEGNLRKIYWAVALGKSQMQSPANDLSYNLRKRIRSITQTFSFNDISSGPRLFSIKGGYGKKEGSHLFIGALWGYGHSRGYYLSPVSSFQNVYERNVVAELDGNLNISKSINASFFYASSVDQDVYSGAQIGNETRNNTSKLSFKRSASCLRVSYFNLKLNLKLKAEGNYSGPNFRSMGLSFYSNDNLKYRITAAKNFSKAYLLSLSYRSEWMGFSTVGNYSGLNQGAIISNQIKLSKRFQTEIDFQPNKFQTLNQSNNGSVNWTFVCNAAVTYTSVKSENPFSAVLFMTYSDYNSEYYSSKFVAGSVVLSYALKSGFTFQNTVYSSIQDGGVLSQVMDQTLTEEFQVSGTLTKKIKSSIRLKYGNSVYGDSWGTEARFDWQLSRHFVFSLSARKYYKGNSLRYAGGSMNSSLYDALSQLKYSW